MVLNFRKLLDVNEIQIRGSLDMRGVQISLMLILSDSIRGRTDPI
jgi:hypothetical protein